MTGRPLYHVDAFAREPFAGNPAAVCLLDGPADPRWMQRVAAEMNLSETAFVHPREGAFSLRWFTPLTEVPLCGHATLASAHVLWESGALGGDAPARFETLSGTLVARRAGDRIEMELPALPVTGAPFPEEAAAALGCRVRESWRTADPGTGDFEHFLVLETEEDVRAARPDFGRLKEAAPGAVLITAASSRAGIDFVSRYFAPRWGVDEDPVTGRAHCSLVPFWCGRLAKEAVTGYQCSARGGYVEGRPRGERVALTGQAVTIVKGTILSPPPGDPRQPRDGDRRST